MDNFDRFILRRLIGTWSYDATLRRFTATMRPLTASARAEVAEEGHKRGLSDMQVLTAIRHTSDSFPQWVTATTENVATGAVNLHDEPVGAVLTVYGTDTASGTEIRLRLLHLGCNGGVPCLLVIDSTRLSLHPADVVRPWADTYLSVGHALTLSVERDGRPWPADGRVFHVARVTAVSRLRPSVVCEVADSGRTYTLEEEQALAGADEQRFGFGPHPMALLFNDEVSFMPLYADFDAGTLRATYAENPRARPLDDRARSLLFDADGKPRGELLYVEIAHTVKFVPH